MEALFIHYPAGTMHFFKKIMAYGSIVGSLTSLPFLNYLYQNYKSTHSLMRTLLPSLSDSNCYCTTILTYYHLIRLIQFSLQVPIRLYITHRISQIQRLRHRNQIQFSLLELCQSWPFKINQSLGVGVYWSFTFVLVYISFVRQCTNHHCYNTVAIPESTITSLSSNVLSLLLPSFLTSSTPFLYRLAVLNCVLFIANMCLSAYWLRKILEEDPFAASMHKRGVVDVETLTRHTRLIKYNQLNLSTSDSRSSSRQASAAHSRANSQDQIAQPLHKGPSPLDDAEYKNAIAAVENDPNYRFKFHECSICMSEFMFEEPVRILRCGHCFHAPCIDQWLFVKANCPLCSRPLEADQSNQRFIQAANAM